MGRSCPKRAYLVDLFDRVRPFPLPTARAMGRNGRAGLARSGQIWPGQTPKVDPRNANSRAISGNDPCTNGELRERRPVPARTTAAPSMHAVEKTRSVQPLAPLPANARTTPRI